MIATVFGVGRAPLAPGTVASLVALPFAWLIAASLGHIGLLVAGLVVGFGAIPFCTAYERAIGREDPSECVIDEVAGQWIACAFAPLTWKAYALAFVLFRFFDIAKIWPISAAEKLKGGLGIMADDLVAGAFAAAIAAVLFFQWGWP
jgi:phosphatidylglycerophosphatase A